MYDILYLTAGKFCCCCFKMKFVSTSEYNRVLIYIKFLFSNVRGKKNYKQDTNFTVCEMNNKKKTSKIKLRWYFLASCLNSSKKSVVKWYEFKEFNRNEFIYLLRFFSPVINQIVGITHDATDGRWNFLIIFLLFSDWIFIYKIVNVTCTHSS